MSLFKVILIGLFLLFPVSAFANIQLPEFDGRVSDFAGVISSEHKEKIYTLIAELEAKTSAEIVVVTMPSIAPYQENEYAQMIFDKWKIGKKGKDNGVLILVAVQERRWRIHTGYGVEGLLTDALCSKIGNEYMVPFLKKGNYSEGIYQGVLSVAYVIGKDAGVVLSGTGNFKFQPRINFTFADLVGFFQIFGFSFYSPIFLWLPLTTVCVWFYWHDSHHAISILLAFVSLFALSLKFYFWFKLPSYNQCALWKVFILGSSNLNTYKGYGGWGSASGGFSSGGFGGGCGGGSSGGGGAGGGF